MGADVSQTPTYHRRMLRDYQVTLKADIYTALRQARRVLAQLPTGGGKTVIIAEICRDAITKGRTALVLVHRAELVEQTIDKLRAVGIEPGVITATRTTPAPVTVAMVQTLARRRVPLTNVCIIDEAHHATASTYGAVLDALPPDCKIIGVTATPVRLDGRALNDTFDELVVGPTVAELTERGFLVPSVCYSTHLETIDVKTTAGDYNKKHLAQFMERSVLYGDLVGTYNSIIPGGKVIVYASSIELSQRYAAEYNAAGIPAAHIDGATDAAQRRRTIDAFRIGAIKALCNYSIITEGFDVPDTDAVQLVRPTKSLSLYLQMVGRALRSAPNKTQAVILDHARNVIRHGFPDEDREWSLLGRAKRAALPPLVEIDIDLPDRATRPPEHLHAVQLQRMERPTDPIDRLIQQQQRYNHKKGWIYHRWKEMNPTPTVDDYKIFAKKMGYHHRWVTHQMNLNTKPPSTNTTQA